MTRLLPILAVVLILRWFALDTGNLLAAHFTFGWTPESCQAKKAVVDRQADPAGMHVSVDCVDESELPHLLAPGSRT